MPLVDYSSDGSEDTERPTKRRRGNNNGKAVNPDQTESGTVDSSDTEDQLPSGRNTQGEGDASNGQAAQSAMPPLPAAFHNLYAHTVRQSAVDDPSLHQGRKRQTPHVRGNWPSHIYIEWHPSVAQHDMLKQLLSAVKAEAGPGFQLTDFLTSDLGAPKPLHISLSRPLYLPTASKDIFLEKVTPAIRSTPFDHFSVAPSNLSWFKSPDSERVFLILRVVTSQRSASSSNRSPNPELETLLKKCNGVAALFDQHRLYQKDAGDENVGEAFHVSIAWTFGMPGNRQSMGSLSVFREDRFKHIPQWEIPIEGVKVKIGNSVHNIPLGGQEGRSSSSGGLEANDYRAFKG